MNNDLLDEYSEIIHEPVVTDMFQLAEQVMDDDTILFIEDDISSFSKRLAARRSLVFRRGDEEVRHVLAVSIDVTDEYYKGLMHTEKEANRFVYENKLKKAMDMTQLSKMQELAAQGWLLRQPMLEMGTPDERSYSSTNYMEVKLGEV